MESCWKENPDMRPSAGTISCSMRKPGFYALCERLEIRKSVAGGCVAHMVYTYCINEIKTWPDRLAYVEVCIILFALLLENRGETVRNKRNIFLTFLIGFHQATLNQPESYNFEPNMGFECIYSSLPLTIAVSYTTLGLLISLATEGALLLKTC